MYYIIGVYPGSDRSGSVRHPAPSARGAGRFANEMRIPPFTHGMRNEMRNAKEMRNRPSTNYKHPASRHGKRRRCFRLINDHTTHNNKQLIINIIGQIIILILILIIII